MFPTSRYELKRYLLFRVWWILTLKKRFTAWRSWVAYGRSVRLRGGSAAPRYQLSAVVVYWYGHKQSMSRLIDALYAKGADIFLVCNRPPTAEEISLWEEKCVGILERANFGQDWGGYKEGWAFVRKEPRYNSLPFVIANDSVYYLDGTDDLVGEIIDHPSDVCAQHINKSAKYHAPSWLLRFGPTVVSSGVLTTFLKNYRLRYGREWAITRGEHRLSSKLSRLGFRFGAVFSGSRLVHRLSERPDRAWPPEILGTGASGSDEILRWSNWFEIPYEAKLVLLRERVGLMAESTNVASTLPLTMARAFGAPLKLDVLKWPNGHSSASISAALRGVVGDEDLLELENWFDVSPTWASTTGIDRIFYRYGVS